jgi:hypothetical protein
LYATQLRIPVVIPEIIGVTMHELLKREYPKLQPAHLSLKNAKQLGISEAVAEQVPIMATPEESM